jgi:hypothetical protein
MLVELRLVHALRDPVEVGKEIRHKLTRLMLPLLRVAQEVVDQRLGMHLLLDVERRRVHHEVAPILLVLPAPHQLGIQVPVPPLVRNA